MTELAITLGSVLSLIVYDVFGLAAGGILVPGYVALAMTSPQRLFGLTLVTLATYGVSRTLGRSMFLFGRRQLVLSVMFGCLLSQVVRLLLPTQAFVAGAGLEAVGWVVPGLIAYWCCRQGVVRTFACLALTSVVVRLALILCLGESMPITEFMPMAESMPMSGW